MFTRSLQCSDSGVFGITGVRGAGKTALTRHCVHQLEGRYFILELTAPIRHDADLGFISSVCRGVCNRIISDLEPILRGRRAGPLWQRTRNWLVILLLVVAAAAFWHGRMSITGPAGLNSALTKGIADRPYNDPRRDPFPAEDVELLPMNGMLGRAPDSRHAVGVVVRAERRLTDHLINEVDRALASVGAAVEAGTVNASIYRFGILPSAADTGHFVVVKSRRQGKSGDFAVRWAERYEASRGERSHAKFLRSWASAGEFRRHFWGTFSSHDETWRHFVASLPGHARYRLALLHNNEAFTHLLAPSTVPPKSRESSSEDGMVEQRAGPAASTDPPASPAPPKEEPVSPGDGTEPEFLSALLLRIFNEAPERLTLDVTGLRIFRELLADYRLLLDGRLDPVAASIAVAEGSGTGSPLGGIEQLEAVHARVLWAALGLVLLILVAAPLWTAFLDLLRAIVNRRYLGLQAEARDFLQQLGYRSSRESSQGLAWKGLSLGRKQTIAARDLSLAAITDRYLRLLEQVRAVYNGRVVISIDELDKIHDPEQTKGLLTELKGALFSPGAFYLISISQDAARSFRQRLAAGRDIFESTFDEVIELYQLDVPAALQMLARFEQESPEPERLPCTALGAAALFGAGIPREIIRARRVLLDAERPERPDGGWAARVLLADELRLWDRGLTESRVTGKQTIALRAMGQAAARSLAGAEPGTEDYGAIFDLLQPALARIDPDGLRSRAGYVSDADAADPATQDDTTRSYARIAADIKAIVRLLILVHGCERIQSDPDPSGPWQRQLLDCHAAVPDKPALAEALLLEMRGGG